FPRDVLPTGVSEICRSTLRRLTIARHEPECVSPIRDWSRSYTLHSADVRESFPVEATALRIRIQKIADRSVAWRTDWRFFPRLICWALTAFAVSALAENAEMAMDKMTDAGRRPFGERQGAGRN